MSEKKSLEELTDEKLDQQVEHVEQVMEGMIERDKATLTEQEQQQYEEVLDLALLLLKEYMRREIKKVLEIIVEEEKQKKQKELHKEAGGEIDE